MASLESIGNSHQVNAPRGDDIPVVRVQEPEEEKPVEKGERAEKRQQAQRVELPTRAFHARLNYDRDSEEVIVEILDPKTGDVITRIPAEELPDDIRALVSESGPLVETFA
jgi:uncharacterized FlaG/YvyC family protein